MSPLPLSFRVLKRQGPGPGGGRACGQGAAAADGRHLRRPPRAAPGDQRPRAGAVPGVAGRGRLTPGPGGPARGPPGPGAARQQPGHQVVNRPPVGVSDARSSSSAFLPSLWFSELPAPPRGRLPHPGGAPSHRLCQWELRLERRPALIYASLYPKMEKTPKNKNGDRPLSLGLRKNPEVPCEELRPCSGPCASDWTWTRGCSRRAVGSPG